MNTDRATVDESAAAADRRRSAIGFLAVCLGYFAIILDGSVLNVAVPVIHHDLGTSTAGAQWVLNGYTLTLSAFLLTAGSLGDRFGLRRTLLAGLTLFALASAGCAAASDTLTLSAARAVQGFGAAALLPATLALIPYLFPQRADRERATVVWVATSAIAVAVGPLVGGVLIDLYGWRSIFLINLPVCAASGLLARRCIGETPRRRTRVDYAGQLLAAVALGGLTTGLISAGAAGWSAPVTLAALVAAALAGTAFVLVERRQDTPLLPPSFFADRLRTTSLCCAVLIGFVFYGTLFVVSWYFQQWRDWSPSLTGLALLPLTAGTVLAPLVLYRPLAERFGREVMIVTGFVGCGLGIGVLGVVGGRAPYPLTAVGLLVVGVFSTFVLPAVTSVVMSTVRPEQTGLASGVQNTARQSGALMSVSVLGAVLNTTDLAGQVVIAFVLIAAVAVLGTAFGGVALRAAAR